MYLRHLAALLAGLAYLVAAGAPITEWWVVALPLLAVGLGRALMEVGDGPRLGEQGTEDAHR